MYYLFLLLVFSIANTNFLDYNSLFLNSKIKKIDFNYYLNYSGIEEIGKANIIISDTCYKLSRSNGKFDNIIISNATIQKNYNSSTNQIFINHSDFETDSLVFHFFNNLELYFNNYFTLDSVYSNIIEYNNDFKMKIFNNSHSIDSIIINSEIYKIKLFAVQLSPYSIDIFDNPFNIDAPNAFILDLRD